MDAPPIWMPPALSDGVLVLDAPTLADAEAHLAGEDEEMRRRFEGRRPATLGEMRSSMQRWIDGRAAGRPIFVYMARLPDVGLIGGCEIRRVSPERADVSYWIYPAHRRQGYAARAMRLLCGAAARIDGLRTLEAHIEADNAASRALAARLGFALVGEIDETAWDGVVTSRLVYVRPAAM